MQAEKTPQVSMNTVPLPEVMKDPPLQKQISMNSQTWSGKNNMKCFSSVSADRSRNVL